MYVILYRTRGRAVGVDAIERAPVIITIRPGGSNYHNFWTSCVKPNKNYVFGILGLKGVDWCMYGSIGEGRGWWVPRGGSDFLGPPLQNFSEALSRNFKDIYGILSSRAVDWHPCWENRLKWGVSRAAQSLTNGLSANSARMEDQDLKCPYCSKLCDNRLNTKTF